MVDNNLYDRVRRRDGMCIIAKFVAEGLLDEEHVCRGRLTFDHVRDQPMMGKRAPTDEWHLTLMCARSNIDGPSRKVRELQRDYLRKMKNEVTDGV